LKLGAYFFSERGSWLDSGGRKTSSL